MKYRDTTGNQEEAQTKEQKGIHTQEERGKGSGRKRTREEKVCGRVLATIIIIIIIIIIISMIQSFLAEIIIIIGIFSLFNSQYFLIIT